MSGELQRLSDEAQDAEVARLDDARRADGEDFDQFWSEQDKNLADRPQLRNVRGVDLILPTSIPLKFEVDARRLADSNTEEDTQYMIGVMFGRGGRATDTATGRVLPHEKLIDEWTERGMSAEQFATLLLWAMANLRGTHLTLSEARDELRDAMSRKKGGDGGKAPPPVISTTRGGYPENTGRRSKRTSGGNTRSGRRGSRR